MPELLPLFLNLTGRPVLLVGGGRVAAAKLHQLRAAGAQVTVVAPEIADDIAASAARSADDGPGSAVRLVQRAFDPADLDGMWLVVAAAPPAVNRAVADAADARQIFVNAVDDPANATAFLSGVIRRDGVTIAVSTGGDAPALTALLREGLNALLPSDLAVWLWRARAERLAWKRDAVPMDARKPRLLRALNALYEHENAATADRADDAFSSRSSFPVSERGPRIPWLSGPEDSWL